MADNGKPEDEDDKTVFLPPSRKGEKEDPGQPAGAEDDDEKTVFVPRQTPGQVESEPPQQHEDNVPDFADLGDTTPSQTPVPPTTPPAPPSQSTQSTLGTQFDGAAPPPDPSAFPSGPSMNTSPIQPVAIGDYVNVFRIERYIAKGGMGEVYEAVNPHPPHESVAVKLMLSDLASDKNALEMFYKEASALGRVHHEAIVQYRIASQSPNGQPYLITEFVPGPSLQEMLGELELDENQLRDLTQRLSRGLGAAHREDVVHRDIAPDNVLLKDGNPERPKIIDFGIVKDTHETGKTIIGDGFAGKLRYVAPEQLGEYDFNVGPWTDIYSLALTMLAVASGKHADMGSSLSDAVRKRLGVPDLSAFPEGLRPAFGAALQPDPADRPQTMEAFAALLESGADTAPTPPQGGEGDGTPFAPMPGGTNKDDPKKKPEAGPVGTTGDAKKRLIYGGIAAVVILGLLVGVLIIATGSDTPEIDDEDVGSDTLIAEAPAKPPIEQVAQQAASQVDCAWLTFDGSDGNTATFSGGAARQGAVLRSLQDAFSSNGYPDVTLDTGKVVSFDETLCSTVNALRSARSPVPLVSSRQASYEMEEQISLFAKGETKNIAKPVLEAKGLVQGEEAMLLYIEKADFGMFAPDRENISKEVANNKGIDEPTGFETSFEYDGLGGHALILVTGPSKFPASQFPQNPGQLINPSQEWARQFEEQARQNGWKTDIIWFRITDDKK